jgi:hypothetical protein
MTPQIREATMGESRKVTYGMDRERIDVNKKYELRDWAISLDMPPDRVVEAVQAVGDRADKVREYLNVK